MSPITRTMQNDPLSAPRVSGDEPIATGLGDVEITCSPRERG